MDPTESDIDRSSLKDEVRRFSEAVRVLYTVQYTARRLLRSSRPQEIFQPPQQGFFSVHAQLQLLGKIFLLFTHHLTSHLVLTPNHVHNIILHLLLVLSIAVNFRNKN
jgi:hypothetical protein